MWDLLVIIKNFCLNANKKYWNNFFYEHCGIREGINHCIRSTRMPAWWIKHVYGQYKGKNTSFLRNKWTNININNIRKMTKRQSEKQKFSRLEEGRKWFINTCLWLERIHSKYVMKCDILNLKILSHNLSNSRNSST